MNPKPVEFSKLVGFLFVSNLLGIGIVAVHSLEHGIFFRECGIAAVMALSVGLLSLILVWSHSRKKLANSLEQPQSTINEPVPQPRLKKYLANASIIAAGIFGWLVLVNGLLAFDVELRQSINNDVASVINWMVPIAAIFAETVVVCCFLAFLIWMIQQDRWRANPTHQMCRNEQAKLRRELAQAHAEANRIAQLNKPDFVTRLNQYVANVETGGEHQSQADEPFVSRAKFWQREPAHKPTLPKPIEFIRRILQRIAKAVHGT